MIKLMINASEGEISVQFDVPDKPGDRLQLDELAAFALHLDLVKHRILDLMHQALASGEGYQFSGRERGSESTLA